MATTKRKDLPIWARPRPGRLGATQPLTAAQKRTAKARAAAAGRKYPNLIDNIAAARNPIMKTFLMSVGPGKPKVETPYDFGFTHYIPQNSYGGSKVGFKFYAHEDGTLTAISEAESGKRVGVVDVLDLAKYGPKTAAKKVIENLLQRHGADKVYAVLSKG